MKIEEVSFLNSKKQNLSGRIFFSEEPSDEGMIFAHGLFSSKDGYKITRLAEDIVKTGLNLLVFDFSFCGDSGNNISEISIFQEVDDLASAFDFFRSRGFKRIHLMGSSMGAAVSLLYSATRPDNLASLITIAAPVDLANLASVFTENSGSRASGDEDYIDIDGTRIKSAFINELNETNIESLLEKIDVPVLIIHGSDDRTVPVLNASLLNKGLGCYHEIVIIDGGDHNLTSEIFLNLLREKITGWLNR